VQEQDKQDFEGLMKGKGYAQIGRVTKDERLVINGLNGKIVVDSSLEQLRSSWKKTLSGES
jgi:hypothetical protein